MKLEDVKVLTQQALAQSMGKDYMTQNGYLEGIPAEKLVDIGKDIEDMGTTEKYTKALVSLMAKFECTTLGYEMMFSDIVVDRIEWGGFLIACFYPSTSTVPSGFIVIFIPSLT